MTKRRDPSLQHPRQYLGLEARRHLGRLLLLPLLHGLSGLLLLARLLLCVDSALLQTIFVELVNAALTITTITISHTTTK